MDFLKGAAVAALISTAIMLFASTGAMDFVGAALGHWLETHTSIFS